jgi:hypothetical protein
MRVAWRFTTADSTTGAVRMAASLVTAIIVVALPATPRKLGRETLFSFSLCIRSSTQFCLIHGQSPCHLISFAPLTGESEEGGKTSLAWAETVKHGKPSLHDLPGSRSGSIERIERMKSLLIPQYGRGKEGCAMASIKSVGVHQCRTRNDSSDLMMVYLRK